MAKFFVPSKEQLAIFNWIKNGTGDAMALARAGSGKTTTIKQAANLLPPTTRGLFCAFNKHIAESLTDALAGTPMRATTIHAFGYGVVARGLPGRGKLDVQEGKYAKIAAKLAESKAEPELRMAANLVGKEHSEARRVARATIKGRGRALGNLINMVRLTRTLSTDTAKLRDLMTTYDIVTDGPAGDAFVLGNLRDVLDAGIDLAEKARIVDYTDMLWLPIVLRMQVPQFDWIFVDECQDLNTCQRDLIMLAKAGRMMLVGDDRQAIMGFAGADTRSFWNIQEMLSAEVFPLPTCYRCPKSHIALAQAIVPDIRHTPTAGDGTIEDMYEADAAAAIRTKDLIMCRMTAPLVSLCLKLIRMGKPARVRGRDIAAQLIELTETIEEIASTYPPVSFLEALERWESGQVERLADLDDAEQRIERIRDLADALRVCYGEWGADMKNRIAGIFANPDEDAAIWLSTVHKAKGLEADRAFILHPRSLPLRRKNQTPEQFAQELNIAYVAVTRAKKYLGFIHKDGDPRPANVLDNLGALTAPRSGDEEGEGEDPDDWRKDANRDYQRDIDRGLRDQDRRDRMNERIDRDMRNGVQREFFLKVR